MVKFVRCWTWCTKNFQTSIHSSRVSNFIILYVWKERVWGVIKVTSRDKVHLIISNYIVRAKVVQYNIIRNNPNDEFYDLRMRLWQRPPHWLRDHKTPSIPTITINQSINQWRGLWMDALFLQKPIYRESNDWWKDMLKEERREGTNGIAKWVISLWTGWSVLINDSSSTRIGWATRLNELKGWPPKNDSSIGL